MDPTIIIILAIILLLLIILNHISIVPGGCAGTMYGCCSDGITPKMNQWGTNCYGYGCGTGAVWRVAPGSSAPGRRRP